MDNLVTIEEGEGADTEALLAAKDAQLAAKEAEIARLRRRIELLEKALFGPRSERIVDDGGRQIEFEALLGELAAAAEALGEFETAVPEVPAPAPRIKRRRRSLAELAPADLPVVEVRIDVPAEDRLCLETGEPLKPIGETRSRKLAFQPGSYYWREYVRPKYASPADPLQGILQAPMPALAIPGSEFDESFLAAIAVDKCAYHLPLYRQEERLRHAGLPISRQTLCRCYLGAAEALAPLYDTLKDEILSRKVLFTDDTPVRLQVKGRGKTVTGRMWVYVAGGTGPPYRIFEFTRDRKKERPREFLGDWRGDLHADAYAGYAGLFEYDGMREIACWMHVRRKFFEASDSPPELRDAILRDIRHLYRYERFAAARAELLAATDRNRERADRFLVDFRQAKAAPVVERIFQRCADTVAGGHLLPKSAFAKAIGYLQGRGDALRTFLTHAHLKPDNGQSERAIRPLAIGRKNWLFAGSQRGGDATGILLSLIQSARVLGLDPLVYLTDVLRRINGHPRDQLADLLPQAWQQARDPQA